MDPPALPHISSLSFIEDYTEDQPHACAFILLRGNQSTKLLRVFLYRISTYDIRFRLYDDHHQTHPLDHITFYFGRLAYGSHMLYPHLPERVMRQFRYLQVVPREPFVSASHSMIHMDVYVMYDDFYNHLVLDEARSVVAPHECSSVFNYMEWYFIMSHLYVTPYAQRDPPRSTQHEML